MRCAHIASDRCTPRCIRPMHSALHPLGRVGLGRSPWRCLSSSVRRTGAFSSSTRYSRSGPVCGVPNGCLSRVPHPVEHPEHQFRADPLKTSSLFARSPLPLACFGARSPLSRTYVAPVGMRAFWRDKSALAVQFESESGGKTLPQKCALTAHTKQVRAAWSTPT